MKKYGRGAIMGTFASINGTTPPINGTIASIHRNIAFINGSTAAINGGKPAALVSALPRTWSQHSLAQYPQTLTLWVLLIGSSSTGLGTSASDR
eukprot:2021704-Rhodomonas_salina.1